MKAMSPTRWSGPRRIFLPRLPNIVPPQVGLPPETGYWPSISPPSGIQGAGTNALLLRNSFTRLLTLPFRPASASASGEIVDEDIPVSARRRREHGRSYPGRQSGCRRFRQAPLRPSRGEPMDQVSFLACKSHRGLSRIVILRLRRRARLQVSPDLRSPRPLLAKAERARDHLALSDSSPALSETLLAGNLPLPCAAYESGYHFFLKYWSIAIGPEPPNTSAARHAR
jgi:hypothetical protein